MWLNDKGLDVTCIRLRPYKDEQGSVLLDVHQVIPISEAKDYQIQVTAKNQAGSVQRSERHDLRFQFWTELLEAAKLKTKLHSNRSATVANFIWTSLKPGLWLTYVVREDESQVEIYVDGRRNKEENLSALRQLKTNGSEIEDALGGNVDWQELSGKRACRICRVFEGGYRSPHDEWHIIQSKMIEAMSRLASDSIYLGEIKLNGP